MTSFKNYTRGTKLHPEDQRYVLAVYVHRPLGGFRIPKDNQRWLETYSFATNKNGRLNHRVQECLPASLTGAE